MEAPNWLKSFDESVADLRFIMQKAITASDLRGDQHRLLIPKKDAEARLVPLLATHERDRTFPPGAILPGGRLARRRRDLATGGAGQPEAAGDDAAAQAALGGVPVDVYQRSGWKFSMQLKYWPSTGEVVLNGGEYSLLISWNNILQVGDVVQLWAFRLDGCLRFVIFKV